MNPIKIIGVAGVLLGAGCSSTPNHTPAVADARSAIRGAEQIGAKNEPKAALHLQLAKEAIAAAEDDIKEGEHENAKMRLDRAKIDAELAIALTEEAEVRSEARELRERAEGVQTSSAN
ncbi:MAG: DUF4398 domain-containing protein [Myxococcales bacterium]|nr:DUF4398 domain-containing protein [Myxococcales bacterium]